MENFTLHTITNELATLLPKQRLGKAYQIGTTDIVLELRGREEGYLYISTEPKSLALHLTAHAPKKMNGVRTDTAFVALAKKYLSNAQITTIEHLGYDRVVRFTLTGETENGAIFVRSLIAQLTGRSANIFILEGENILAALRSHEATTYQEPPPPADKIDPFDCPPEKLQALLDAHEGDAAAAARLHLLGFGPQFAAEFAARTQYEAPAQALQKLLAEIFSPAPDATVYSSTPLAQLQIGADEWSLAFAPIALEHLRTLHATKFVRVNLAAEKYFSWLLARRDFWQHDNKSKRNSPRS